jgi:hypothetical protein
VASFATLNVTPPVNVPATMLTREFWGALNVVPPVKVPVLSSSIGTVEVSEGKLMVRPLPEAGMLNVSPPMTRFAPFPTEMLPFGLAKLLRSVRLISLPLFCASIVTKVLILVTWVRAGSSVCPPCKASIKSSLLTVPRLASLGRFKMLPVPVASNVVRSKVVRLA